MVSRFFGARRAVHLCAGGALAALALLLAGCDASSPSYADQRAFRAPEEAVSTLLAAAEAGDADTLRAIFGAAGEDVLSSGDSVADQNNREVFVVAMHDSWTLEEVDSQTRELIVGHEHWPFPIPIVKDSHGWWFDTEAGRLEVLARRIGRNELAAIGTLQAYVVAQLEYAGESRDGKSAGVYAQRVRSDAGRHNGLYWPAESPSDTPSPLSDFAASAAEEGYTGERAEGMNAYHGYYFRILTRQGADAPGGALDYIVDGDMTLGFAMVAFPAEYGNSGVMTFLVGHDGVVYESDLGDDTLAIAGQMTEHNPGPAWRIVE